MKVTNITFQTCGYGHILVYGHVNNTSVSFTTANTKLTDSAQDEDAPTHEEAMTFIKSRLIEEFLLNHV